MTYLALGSYLTTEDNWRTQCCFNCCQIHFQCGEIIFIEAAVWYLCMSFLPRCFSRYSKLVSDISLCVSAFLCQSLSLPPSHSISWKMQCIISIPSLFCFLHLVSFSLCLHQLYCFHLILVYRPTDLERAWYDIYIISSLIICSHSLPFLIRLAP